jgi:hypothetical protein
MASADAPKNRHLLAALFTLSILLSIPSILKIPRMVPLASAEVRGAALQAVDMLRSQGIWVVNADLQRIHREEGGICFDWEHRYTARAWTGEPKILTTCVDV